MEVIHSSKMLVITYKITWHYNPEDHNPCTILSLSNRRQRTWWSWISGGECFM
jgi:hypothetical protein